MRAYPDIVYDGLPRPSVRRCRRPWKAVVRPTWRRQLVSARTLRDVKTLSVALAAVLLVTGFADAQSNSGGEGFESLFNGKDLTGWEGVDGAWQVKDGAIWCTGASAGKNWLIWRGGKLDDFELRLKFKFVQGNSGVQVRSKEIKPFMVRGYQVEVAAREKMGLWHHSLSPTKQRSHLATAGQKVHIAKDGTKTVEQLTPADKVQAAYRTDDWNDLVVIANGPRLIQKINGVVFVDLTDEETEHATRSGLLALQDHGKGTVVGYKDIRLKRLSK